MVERPVPHQRVVPVKEGGCVRACLHGRVQVDPVVRGGGSWVRSWGNPCFVPGCVDGRLAVFCHVHVPGSVVTVHPEIIGTQKQIGHVRVAILSGLGHAHVLPGAVVPVKQTRVKVLVRANVHEEPVVVSGGTVRRGGGEPEVRRGGIPASCQVNSYAPCLGLVHLSCGVVTVNAEVVSRVVREGGHVCIAVESCCSIRAVLPRAVVPVESAPGEGFVRAHVHVYPGLVLGVGLVGERGGDEAEVGRILRKGKPVRSIREASAPRACLDVRKVKGGVTDTVIACIRASVRIIPVRIGQVVPTYTGAAYYVGALGAGG